MSRRVDVRNQQEVKRIEITDPASLKEVASTMKRKEPFVIVTDDNDFNPLGKDRHSIEVWIGAAGGGMLMLMGAEHWYWRSWIQNPRPS